MRTRGQKVGEIAAYILLAMIASLLIAGFVKFMIWFIKL